MSLNIRNAFDFIEQRYPKYKVSIKEMALKKQKDNGMIQTHDQHGLDYGHANENGIQGWWTNEYSDEMTGNAEWKHYRYSDSKKVEERTYLNGVVQKSDELNDEGKVIVNKRYWSNGNLERVTKYPQGSAFYNNRTEYEYGMDGKIKSETMQRPIRMDKQRGTEEFYYKFNDKGQRCLYFNTRWLVGLNSEDHLKETHQTSYWPRFDGKEIPMMISNTVNNVTTTTYFNEEGNSSFKDTENGKN